MKVTAIAAGTSTLTVIRNVAPNCLGYFNENGVAAAANSIVTLLQPVFDTVQLVDSVTKQATQAAGADGNPVSSGSCAMVSLKVAEANDGGFTVTDNVLTFDGGKLTIAQGSITEAAPGVFTSTAHGLSVGDAVTYYSNGGTSIDVLTNGATYYVTATTFAANTFTLATTVGGAALTVGNDGNDAQFFVKTAIVNNLPKVGGLVVGDLINMANEFMLVTGVTKTNADGTEGTLTVVRDVLPPCPSVTAGTAAAHANDVAINKVVPGGCYAMPATTARELAATITTDDTTITVDANTGMQVGGYLFHDGTTGHTGASGEYMLITDIDGTTLTVVRNVAPPCVMGHTVLTSTLATGATTANTLFVLSLPGSDNMISTSMRAIVELSPREPIVWAPVAPALPPSAFYVDVKVGIEYSEAEFATKAAAFTRAMSALTGVAVESTTVSYSAARRARGNVNARSYVLSQAEVTALLNKLGADTDTCTCGSSCQAALLKAVNEKLVAEGVKPATSAEIVFNDQCKPKKKSSDDNLLLLLLLLLLIPIGAAVYWCCKQEPVAPVGKPPPMPAPAQPMQYGM